MKNKSPLACLISILLAASAPASPVFAALGHGIKVGARQGKITGTVSRPGVYSGQGGIIRLRLPPQGLKSHLGTGSPAAPSLLRVTHGVAPAAPASVVVDIPQSKIHQSVTEITSKTSMRREAFGARIDSMTGSAGDALKPIARGSDLNAGDLRGIGARLQEILTGGKRRGGGTFMAGPRLTVPGSGSSGSSNDSSESDRSDEADFVRGAQVVWEKYAVEASGNSGFFDNDRMAALAFLSYMEDALVLYRQKERAGAPSAEAFAAAVFVLEQKLSIIRAASTRFYSSGDMSVYTAPYDQSIALRLEEAAGANVLGEMRSVVEEIAGIATVGMNAIESLPVREVYPEKAALLERMREDGIVSDYIKVLETTPGHEFHQILEALDRRYIKTLLKARILYYAALIPGSIAILSALTAVVLLFPLAFGAVSLTPIISNAFYTFAIALASASPFVFAAARLGRKADTMDRFAFWVMDYAQRMAEVEK